MTNTFLISEVKLRTFTDLDNNLDSELLKSAIRLAQDVDLQKIIGTKLYKKLIALVDADEMDLGVNAKYKTLLVDYIQDLLLQATYYYALENIYLRPRNNGLVKPMGGENSDGVDRELFNMKRQSIENARDFYANRLTAYIIEEQVQFPELNSSNKLYEQHPDYTNKYGSPFVFNKRSKMAEEFIKRGYRVYDTSKQQFPQ